MAQAAHGSQSNRLTHSGQRKIACIANNGFCRFLGPILKIHLRLWMIAKWQFIGNNHQIHRSGITGADFPLAMANVGIRSAILDEHKDDMAKDRAKDLLSEMELLRQQKKKYGRITMPRRGLTFAVRREMAGLLMRASGFELQSNRDVINFLSLIALHLYGDFRPGRPRSFPMSDDELLKEFLGVAEEGRIGANWPNKSKALRSLKSRDARLLPINLPALTRQFDRAIRRRRASETAVKLKRYFPKPKQNKTPRGKET